MGTGNLNACHSSLLMIGDVKAEGLFKREQDVMPYTPLGLWLASTAGMLREWGGSAILRVYRDNPLTRA